MSLYERWVTTTSADVIELPRISIAKGRKEKERERERERLAASDASGEISFVAPTRWIMQQRVLNTEDGLRVRTATDFAAEKGVKQRRLTLSLCV